MSFDKTVQISRVCLDDSGSVTSEESDGPFDYGSSAHIAEPHDISMGVRYDDALIDRINATSAPYGTWPTAPPYTEIVYEDQDLNHHTAQFYNAIENPQ
jgi:hypothetical protein